MAGFKCTECKFELWVPIGDLRVSALGLYDDDRYPGRCLLALREHADRLEALGGALAAAFVHDAQQAGEAIRLAVSADRINYAVLGNAESHLHWHLIPRLAKDDPIPKRAPWQHPRPKGSLEPEHRDHIVEAIRSLL